MIYYNNDIYIYIWGRGQGGPFRVKNHVMSLGSPGILAKTEDSSELTLASVIMPIIANNDKM